MLWSKYGPSSPPFGFSASAPMDLRLGAVRNVVTPLQEGTFRTRRSRRKGIDNGRTEEISALPSPCSLYGDCRPRDVAFHKYARTWLRQATGMRRPILWLSMRPPRLCVYRQPSASRRPGRATPRPRSSTSLRLQYRKPIYSPRISQAHFPTGSFAAFTGDLYKPITGTPSTPRFPTRTSRPSHCTRDSYILFRRGPFAPLVLGTIYPHHSRAIGPRERDNRVLLGQLPPEFFSKFGRFPNYGEPVLVRLNP